MLSTFARRTTVSPGTLQPRAVVPLMGGLLLVLLIVLSGSALWLGVCAAALVGAAVLARLGPVRLLYVYAAFVWLLPRIYVPGMPGIVPLHILLAGGIGMLCGFEVLAGARSRKDVLPPLWPLAALYCLGGFAGFFTGRIDVDTVNGLKFLMEACGLAPLVYLLVWTYLRETRDGERVILLLSFSTLVLGTVAYIFQGSAFWTPIPFEQDGLRLSGQYQFGPLYLIVTPVMMSTQLSMLIPALCSLAVNSTDRKHKIAAMVAMWPLGLLLLLAAGRSGWMGTIAGLAIVLFFSIRAGKVSVPRLAAGMVALGVVGVIAAVSLGLVNEEISRRILSFATLLEDDTVVFRYWIWGIGIDLVGQYPFGVGFQVIRGLYGYPAHNQYILWALGTGVGGFAAIIAMFLAWGNRMVRLLLAGCEPVRPVALAALGAVAGALISINGDNISTSVGWTQTTLWMMLGLGMAALARHGAETAREKGV